MGSTTINDLRNQLQAMLDNCEDKPQIAQIGALTNLVDKLEDEHKKLQDEQKELLKDYKELVKHQSFKSNGTEETPIPEAKVVSFDDFLTAKPNTTN